MNLVCIKWQVEEDMIPNLQKWVGTYPCIPPCCQHATIIASNFGYAHNFACLYYVPLFSLHFIFSSKVFSSWFVWLFNKNQPHLSEFMCAFVCSKWVSCQPKFFKFEIASLYVMLCHISIFRSKRVKVQCNV
jgi:hypothetical protein